jgi:hypothetical protein
MSVSGMRRCQGWRIEDIAECISLTVAGGLLKPIRDKPQCASNGDERPNRENATQLAVFQSFQAQPQPDEHHGGSYK